MLSWQVTFHSPLTLQLYERPYTVKVLLFLDTNFRGWGKICSSWILEFVVSDFAHNKSIVNMWFGGYLNSWFRLTTKSTKINTPRIKLLSQYIFNNWTTVFGMCPVFDTSKSIGTFHSTLYYFVFQDFISDNPCHEIFIVSILLASHIHSSITRHYVGYLLFPHTIYYRHPVVSFTNST